MSSTEHSLTRHARYAGWACRLMALAIPLLVSWAWYLGTAQVEIFQRSDLQSLLPLSTLQTALALCLSILPALALARSRFYAAQCFDRFAGAHWFGPAQPALLNKAGRWLVISGILTFVIPTLLGVILTFHALPGHRALVIAISSNGILAILFGVLLWSMGHLWARATELASENARYV